MAKNIKSVGIRATRILDIVTNELDEPGDGHKINNNETYIPLSVNYVYDAHGHPVFSLCHYSEQNGDLMTDPEVLFWYVGGTYYPLSFRNDFVPVDNVYVEFCEDGGIQFNPKAQNDLVSFCNTWMQNIKHQQKL